MKMNKALLVIMLLMSYCILSACNGSSSESETVPDLMGITLYAEDGSQIVPEEGWHKLQGRTKIEVKFDGEVEHIFFYFIPTGTETMGLREKIGYVCAYDLGGKEIIGFGYDSGSADYIWEVPTEEFIGYLSVDLINGTVARVTPFTLKITNCIQSVLL